MIDPHNLLSEVHSDLALVMRTAAQTPQAFQVVYGLRTPVAEEEAVQTGHSETTHSRHLAGGGFNENGYAGKALAVDIACLDNNGNIDWTVAAGDGGNYHAASVQILAAAARLGLPVQWGGQIEGAWTDGVVSHFRDWGHYQLDPSKYP
jgi:peptidoglycan LD-endopeptidase CwlK